MNDTISGRLAELGIALPAAPSPAANYVPFVTTGNLVYISGQLPMIDGTVQYAGCAGDAATIDDGYAAARLCAINVVAQLAAAVGDRFARVKRCVNLTVFVNATPAFTEQPKIANGASDLVVEIFGDAGRHSRAAVGVGSLPRGALTEVQAVFEIALSA
jgi:enamine deaminase RidA (YjgF/YER057c/UK114 family)